MASPDLPSPSWHFPGPSSKYHSRVKDRPRLTRFQSTYIPQAPVFATEKRAQLRRANSAAVFASPASSVGGDWAAFNTRSPLSSSTTYNSSSSGIAVMPARIEGHVPSTPTKAPHRSLLLQDSPFSDYYTDDAQSTANTESVYTEPSRETQQLLLRLNNLGSQLLRDDTAIEAMSVMMRKIGELENELDMLHSQTRTPAEMEDSGLFMDADDDNQDSPNEQIEHTPNSTVAQPVFSHSQLDGASDEHAEKQTDSGSNHVDHDILLHEAQQVLESVAHARCELRKRYHELRELNDTHILRVEESEQAIEELRSENEALKSDLGFDHSELLYLKLQLKALEVQIDSLDQSGSDAATVDDVSPAAKAGIQRIRKGMLVDEMDRWRSDWQGLDTRFRRRRGRYGVLSAGGRDTSVEQALDAKKDEEERCRLETGKTGCGMVQSTTSLRQEGSDNGFGTDGTTDDASSPALETTQTDSPPTPDKPADEPYSLRVAYQPDAEDKWAITSGSEQGDDGARHAEVGGEGMVEAIKEIGKTAWQELVDGLTALAGLPAEEDD